MIHFITFTPLLSASFRLFYLAAARTDSHLIYGIANDGLYVYDAEERKNQKLLSGEDLYKITGYDRGTNIIEYDDTKARIIF